MSEPYTTASAPTEGPGDDTHPDADAESDLADLADLAALNAQVQGTFVGHLGVTFTEVGPHRVVATWTARPELHQPYGIVHGGVHASVVETLASVGAAAWMSEQDPEGQVVGVNNSTDFYRAVREGDLASTATALHQGRSQQVWVVETRDARERLVARGQVRLQNLTD